MTKVVQDVSRKYANTLVQIMHEAVEDRPLDTFITGGTKVGEWLKNTQ